MQESLPLLRHPLVLTHRVGGDVSVIIHILSVVTPGGSSAMACHCIEW